MDGDLTLTPDQEQRAAALHRDSLVIDVHTDVHLEVLRRRGRGETQVMRRLYYDRWRQAGLDAVVLATMSKFGPEPYPYYTSPTRNFLLMTDAIAEEIAECPNCFLAVREPADIPRARAAGKIGIVLGVEGAEAIESDLGLLRCYHRLGLRIMVLSWHQRNLVADGVAEPSNAGLSNFGRDVVREMNRLGIIIDVSHLSAAGVDDVIKLSRQPVVASHSNAKALCNHQRNLTDEQIRAIAGTGGVVGVVFLGRFVARENPTLNDVLDHVDHLVKIAGPAHVAMGPDYVDGAEDMIIQSRRVAGPGQPVNDPDIPYARGVERMEQLANFTRGLVARGHDDATIRGILGENFLRVFQQTRQAATKGE